MSHPAQAGPMAAGTLAAVVGSLSGRKRKREVGDLLDPTVKRARNAEAQGSLPPVLGARMRNLLENTINASGSQKEHFRAETDIRDLFVANETNIPALKQVIETLSKDELDLLRSALGRDVTISTVLEKNPMLDRVLWGSQANASPFAPLPESSLGNPTTHFDPLLQGWLLSGNPYDQGSQDSTELRRGGLQLDPGDVRLSRGFVPPGRSPDPASGWSEDPEGRYDSASSCRGGAYPALRRDGPSR